jgi:hypothetical protein
MFRGVRVSGSKGTFEFISCQFHFTARKLRVKEGKGLVSHHAEVWQKPHVRPVFLSLSILFVFYFESWFKKLTKQKKPQTHTELYYPAGHGGSCL